MSTKKTQRIGILVILIVTLVGTVGSFLAMALSAKNDIDDQAKFQKLYDKYEEEKKEYDKKVAAQADELSNQYYDIFKPYAEYVSVFDIDSVKELTTEDLKVGDGADIDGKTKMSVYYIGWDARANIFDQSIDNNLNKLKSPLAISDGIDNIGVIEGWKEGIKGMKIGGVRLITIPSDKAYGEEGSKDQDGKETIAANMPLKFIVMAIESPKEIEAPDTTELLEAYGN